MFLTHAVIDLFQMLIMLVLLFFCMSSMRDMKKAHAYFTGLVISHLGLLLVCSILEIVRIKGARPALAGCLLCACCCFVFFENLFYHYYVYDYISKYYEMTVENRIIVSVYGVLYFLICLLSVRDGIFFDVDGIGHVAINGNVWIFIVIAMTLPIFDMISILIKGKYIHTNDMLTWISFTLLPFMAVALVDIFDMTPVLMGMTLSVLLIFVMITINQEREILAHEIEVKESKLNITLSQIQPHFLYNVLSAIAQLCEENPMKAKEMTVMFGDYLRKNMDDITNQNLVPFETEFKHLKTYLFIEKARFEDALNIEYDIEVTDFLLPTLTLQPIVENAVKYGIRGKEDGGTVKISTKRTDNGVDVIIEDDGVGFDANASSEDKRSHVGIRNVSDRLEIVGHATMDIRSTVGVGTRVTIHVGREK